VGNWTVMLYLAGADDLEPFMARALLALEEAGPPPGAEVIVQLARAPLSAVRQFLPDRGPTGIDGDWSGMRRYRLRRRPPDAPTGAFCSELLADLGNASISDPCILAAFVAETLERFPSERSLLLVSGHGMGFVGVALDLATGPHPTLMTIRSLSAALRRVGRTPDILLADACQINALDVIAQFALPSPAADWLVTPASHAPRAGMDYRALLGTLGRLADAPTREVAAGLAEALEPSAGLQVLAFSLAADRWGAVAEAARLADGPTYRPMYAEAARACIHPASGAPLRLLVTWPDPAFFPERYHYLYRRLQFARRSGWDRFLPVADRHGEGREAFAPLRVPGPLLYAWLWMLRSDLDGGQLAALLDRLGWGAG
jgi:hypothetical protein